MKHYVWPLAAMVVATLGSIVLPGDASAQQPRSAADAGAANLAAPLSPQARGELARQYVRKWGGYVQKVYGVPVGVWAERMVSTFAHADPANFRGALKRTTYEGASAMLSGAGARLSDAQVIDSMARNKLAPAAVRKLGDLAADLVYTPVTPCRILDTRVAGGTITGNTSRDFNAVVGSGGNFSSQGGSATSCNMVSAGQAAVVINLTAVTPTSAGYATAFPFGTAQPLASSLNYAAGAIVNNVIVVKLPSPLTTKDFTLYTFATAHYVADIVGYYAPPQATEFDCTSTSVQTFTIAANSTNFFNNLTCPAGYKAVTPYCWTAASGVYSQGSGYNANQAGNATFCSWQNTTAAAQSVFGGNICCRVPGR